MADDSDRKCSGPTHGWQSLTRSWSVVEGDRPRMYRLVLLSWSQPALLLLLLQLLLGLGGAMGCGDGATGGWNTTKTGLKSTSGRVWRLDDRVQRHGLKFWSLLREWRPVTGVPNRCWYKARLWGGGVVRDPAGRSYTTAAGWEINPREVSGNTILQHFQWMLLVTRVRCSNNNKLNTIYCLIFTFKK